jgi:hypothetical protein
LCTYALGTVVPDASPVSVAFQPVMMLMFGYYISVGLLFNWIGGQAAFWVGFGLYSFVLAFVFVEAIRNVRSLRSSEDAETPV